ncbi:hypothetical protein ABPG77_008063 [Micractinium sp. CCAP 211/92]
MAGLPEELEFEVEALRATYDDVEVALEPGHTDQSSRSIDQPGSAAAAATALVTVPVAPRGCPPEQRFVTTRLQLRVPPGYPADAPAAALADARGLGDGRLGQLQAALALEAAALAGELSLGHLVETALDLLTEHNRPEGLCAFCLERLPDPSDPAAPGAERQGALLRLQCYHCFHFACFAPWWQWQQQRLALREAQLRQEYKSMAPLKLEEEGIRQEAAPGPAGLGGGARSNSMAAAAGCDDVGVAAAGAVAPQEPQLAYVLACPACRAEVAPSSLAFAWARLQAASACPLMLRKLGEIRI